MADKFDFIEDYFKKAELLPAIVQERSTGQVLMLAYMNRESMRKTFETGYTWFYSRSRQELWNKGATSGNMQQVKRVTRQDLRVTQEVTHAFSIIYGRNTTMAENKGELYSLYETIVDRKENKQEGSYTCYLFEKGLDKILKKVGEECTETVIAAKNGDNHETVLEISDLIYHLFVMMVNQGIELEDVLKELDKRSEKTGNLKTFHQVDKNT